MLQSSFCLHPHFLSARNIHITSRVLRRRSLLNKKQEDVEGEESEGRDLKFVEKTTQLDEEQSERKLLDNFFATNAGDMDERFRRINSQDDFPTDTLSRLERLKIDQEKERIENGPERPYHEIKRDPESKRSLRVDDKGSMMVEGAELPDRYHDYFTTSSLPSVNDTRDKRQELAEKKLMATMERAKAKKKAIYLRDVNDYPFTRRQLRVSQEYYQSLCDALACAPLLQPLRELQVQFDDVKISLSLRKVTVYWSVVKDVGSPSQSDVGKAKSMLAKLKKIIRFEVQERVDMKWAPDLDYVYSVKQTHKLISLVSRLDEISKSLDENNEEQGMDELVNENEDEDEDENS